jgi:hypothetical protein
LYEAIKTGRECSNAGYVECMMFMPMLLSNKSEENYKKNLIEAYSWLILSEIFYKNSQQKTIAKDLKKNFLNENKISYEMKIKAQEIAKKWIPDGMFRYIN